ncbi:hypothetical protein BC826DRAFT_1068607 [Russula brevipes]|nr:hypothetical protein BC826DRAFT_1068607 [Russula brevipes]
MAPLNSTQACRKYVDLISGISGRYPNWNPLGRIEVGDFGRIDPETGQFVCEGNIYRDEPLASITKSYPPTVTEPVQEYKIDTSSTTRLSALPDFGNLSDIVYKCQWKFKDNRAAFMVMHRARKISIPSSFLKMALKDENPVPEIRTKNVVTGVWSCPSFAMYLSNKSSEHVRIALRASNTGSGQETGWYAEGNVGVYQFGSLPNDAYLPLYQLQKIRKRNLRPRRDGRDQNEIIWATTDAPWRELDDDGIEVPSDHGEWVSIAFQFVGGGIPLMYYTRHEDR